MTISETKQLAERLVGELQAGKRAASDAVDSTDVLAGGATVIGLFGDLGAGKTTFMQFFAEALGVREKILSPTFVIEKIYKIGGRFDHLIHIDAYRLENPEEMRTLGWDEIVKNPRNLIAVEWADKIEPLLPADCVRITFQHQAGDAGTDAGYDERTITIS